MKKNKSKLIKKVAPNWDFLLDLLEIESVSGEEYLVQKIILKELDNLGFQYEIDNIGNISATRGKADKYPLLNAHMDIVEYWDYGYGLSVGKKTKENSYLEGYMENHSKEIEKKEGNLTYLKNGCIIEKETDEDDEDDEMDEIDELKEELDYYYSRYDDEVYYSYLAQKYGNIDIEEEPYEVYCKDGWIKGRGKQRVLGGDDKCGVFIALEIAKVLINTPMKILFTVQEEIGCIGIKYFAENHREWFDDISYSLTIDRRYGNQILWSQMGRRSCSNLFASKLAMMGILCSIPIEIDDGSLADVVTIRELVPNSVNVSAGYYNPHDVDEKINSYEVEKIIQWLSNFVKDN